MKYKWVFPKEQEKSTMKGTLVNNWKYEEKN